MREGCWIRSTSDWHWIIEHASWIQKPENARLLGLPEEVQSELSTISWDFNGPGREAILRLAMSAGLIRMRGHGSYVTFEFTTPIEAAIKVVAPFMERHLGPITWCNFNDLETGQSLGIFYRDLCEAIDKEILLDLLARAGESSMVELSTEVPDDTYKCVPATVASEPMR